VSETTVTLDGDHRYWAEKGKRRWELPGVSFLIEQKFGKNAWFTKKSAHRGSMVHRATALDDQGILDESTVAPELQGYLDAWRQFKIDKRVEVQQVEFVCYSLSLGYAGTADRLITWSTGPMPCLVDIKSGGKTDTHWLQCAAYVRGVPSDIAESWREIEGLIVYVKPTGKYTLDYYSGNRLFEAVRLWEAIPREYAQRETKIEW
jgi:hypothetical protein